MKNHSNITFLIALMLLAVCSNAQESKNIAEKLGYKKDAKLLIIHADDIGLAQSVNKASIMAFEKGGITSGSMMVPCPWSRDFAAYYQSQPDLCIGIHITLTAEWERYKWGGVMPSNKISSLLDEHGSFYASVEELGKNADPLEAEKEIRAQIERALAWGISPTHLDTHMGSVAASPELIQIYLKLGMEYGLPLLIPRSWTLSFPAEVRAGIEKNNVLLDGFFMLEEAKPGVTWEEAYGNMIEAIEPGLTQMIVHVAIDNEEMQAVTINHPDFGATWRQNDLDLVNSKKFQDKLKQNDIQLVSWKEIKSVM